YRLSSLCPVLSPIILSEAKDLCTVLAAFDARALLLRCDSVHEFMDMKRRSSGICPTAKAPTILGVMTQLHIGDQLVHFDREATIAAYSALSEGWADRCTCLGCRNFARQRESIYPTEFRALLDTLGLIPTRKVRPFTMGPRENSNFMADGSTSSAKCWKWARVS